MIVAVAVKADQHCDVDILTNEGVKIKPLFSNSRLVYSYPKFSADDKYIFLIVRNDAGEMSLLEKNIADGNTNTLLPYSNRIIGFPVVEGDTLIYSCSNNGHDEIWAYVHAQHRQYRLATYSTGLYQATMGGNNQLVSSAFTADGYRLAAFTPQWQPENNQDTLANLFVTKPFNINANNTLASVGTQPYAVTKYPKLFHPFNFHSWRPSYSDPDFTFTIYGENVLNTLQSQLYYDYNTNENYHKVGYQAIYGGWYVQPVIGLSQIFQRNAVLNSDTSFHWNEFNASAGLQLPLNLSGGKSYRYLTLGGTYNIDNVQWTGVAKQLRNNINFNYVQGSLSYTSQVQQAAQNIYPRWAQTLFLQYRSITNKYTANQFLANGSLYFPGLLKSHSFVLNGSYQSRDTMNEYSFTNNFPFSRGYSNYNFPRMWKLGANYHFPLCYPDWGFGNIVYFQRIRANAFFDYTSAKSLRSNTSYQFKTAGAEIYFDTQWWNQQPVTIGIRYSRLINNKLVGQQPNQWEIILPVSLLN